MRNFSIFCGLTMAIACGGSDDDTGAANDAFAPTAGQWSWQGTEYSNDTCNMAEAFPAETVDATLWDLVVTDDGFSLDNEVWTDPAIQCVLTDMDFSCTIVTEATPEAWPDGSDQEGVPNVTSTTNATVTGSFSDSETATISMTGELDCAGDDCDAYNEANNRPVPCNTTVNGGFALSE